MLRISWQTLRARPASLAGAFAAVWLAVTLAFATGLLMTSALSAPGPGRFTAADAVVRADPTVRIGHGEDAENVDARVAPRLPVSAVARAAAVPGVERAVGDVAFPAGGHGLHASDGSTLIGHGWDSAALTPFRLTAGRAPATARDVVVDGRLGVRAGSSVRISTPAGTSTYRVSGVAAASDAAQAALFFAPETARTLSGHPDEVNAIGIVGKPGPGLERIGEVLDHDHAVAADAGDPKAADREALVAIFGAMGGIAGAVALFVVAGTFALAIAQRRREVAVLRALGATPLQVRRLIAAEALIVSLVAGGLGLLAGRPLARAIADVLVDHGNAPAGFEPAHSWIPLVAAIGMGIGVAQIAVVAAAWRAGRVRPAEALREAAIDHARPGWLALLSGVSLIGGGVAMAIVFSGVDALSFSVLTGLMLAGGVGLLGRWLLGLPAAALSWPLRALGISGLLASTSLAANRWRTAALATPLMLIAVLAGSQALLQTSDQRNTERVTAARVAAGHVVVGRDGAPLPATAAADIARLPGVKRATAMTSTEVFLLDKGLTNLDESWSAAGLGDTRGTLDLGVVAGSLRDVGGDGIAVSRVLASDGGLAVGDRVHARMADTAPRTLRVAAIYDRSEGLGDVVLDPAVAARHAASSSPDAVFVAGRAPHGALTRSQYLGTVKASNQEESWGVWLIIGLAAAFSALALVNTAAMATAERREELATIRLLGGTSGHVLRMIALELAPTVLVALAAGAGVVAVAVMGVPRGIDGIDVMVPGALLAAMAGGAALLGLAAGAVSARLALRASPAGAMRVRE